MVRSILVTAIGLAAGMAIYHGAQAAIAKVRK